MFNLKNIFSKKKYLLKARKYGDTHDDPVSLGKTDKSYYEGYWVYNPPQKTFVYCETSKQVVDILRSIPLSEYISDESESDSDSESESESDSDSSDSYSDIY